MDNNSGKLNSEEAVRAALDAFDGDINKLVSAARAESNRRVQRSKPLRQTSGEVIISVKDLKKTYKVGKTKINALNGVTLDIHKGEFVALTGASGSGKSTLLQLIGGLDKPSDGIVSIDSQNLAKLSDRKISIFRNKTIGFVFQFFYLQPFLRLQDNLEVPGMPARMGRSERQARVAELADLVGLSDRLRHFPKELSGGQMQRAAIARALLNRPSIILADEPTGNLDSVNGRAIIDLFERIRDELGTTIIVVTHDSGIAARADREIHLKDGVVV